MSSNAALKLRLSIYRCLGERTPRRQHDAALLIAHLSKIRRLAITGNWIRHFDLIGKVLHSKVVGRHPPRFERLKLIIYFHGFDYDAPAPLHRFDEVMSLFHVPTVTHLAAQMGSTELFH
ncbi:unnamed protein product [Clonostachys chloroleuca]|uniref:Uncharacterized protein n=1 Tax=Clonostachys chloroleuca TaxID=1926264 RepID=A0AA35Q2M3_9HYPO|nr:unnamed protein product [Clonostachys chloroleuca]